MAEKFLNLSGLNTLWSKIKTALNGKANFLYGRVYVATSYNSANPYLLLASTNITFSANWQETSEFLIRLYDGSAANKTRTLKIQLNIGGTKTAIYDTKFFKRIYQMNLTDEQVSAIRVRYTFVEGECKFWIYFDRTKFQTIYTCIHIQPQSIGKGDRSNTISNGLNYWSLNNYSTSYSPEMEVGVMEGENELELGTTEIIATIAEAKTISETLPISKGGTGATTRYEAEYNLLGESGTVETTITDERLFALRNQNVSASNGAMRWIKCSVIWTYIQNKISSILGLTASAYNGTSAKATADANGANIADTYATKTEVNDKQDKLNYSDTEGMYLIKVQQADSLDGCNVDKTSSPYISSSTALVPCNQVVADSITYALAQFTGNVKDVTFNSVASADGDLASKRFVATNYEKLLEVGAGLEINDKSDGTCRIIKMKAQNNPTSVLFKTNEKFQVPLSLTLNNYGQLVSTGTLQTLPIPIGFGNEGNVLLSNGDGNLPTWQSFPSNIKRVQSFTSYIANTNSYANLSLFRQTAASSRLHVDADIALYGNGSAADFKILISFGSNSSGSIFKQRICVIPFSDSFTPTFELRKDSTQGFHYIVWTNCPKSEAEIYVSINSYKAQGFLVPSLLFNEDASSFGTKVTANVKVV